MNDVVIIGQGYLQILAAARSVGHLGYTAHVVRIIGTEAYRHIPHKLSVDGSSKYVANYDYVMRDAKALAKLLVDKYADYDEKPVLIPVGDFAAFAIDEAKEQLQEYFFLPYAKNGSLAHFMDKLVQNQMAEEAGVPVLPAIPAEDFLAQYGSNSEDRGNATEGITYPVFLKPRVSHLGKKSYLSRCDSIEDVERVMAKAAKTPEAQLTVEPFVDIEEEYAVVGVSDGETVIMPALIVFELVTHGDYSGVCVSGRLENLSEYGELQERLADFVRAIGLVGLFDIDLFRANGTIYFGEINLRMGASTYALTAADINLPALFVRSITGIEPLSPSMLDDMDVSGTEFFNPRHAFQDHLNKGLSDEDYRALLESDRFEFLSDPDDTAPESRFGIMKAWYTASQLRKRLRS